MMKQWIYTHEEAVLYIFLGGITFFIEYELVNFFNKYVDTLISNAVSWFLCVLYYIISKKLSLLERAKLWTRV